MRNVTQYLYCNTCSMNSSYNFTARSKGVIFTILGILLPILLLVNFLASAASAQFLESMLGNSTAAALKLYMVSHDL